MDRLAALFFADVPLETGEVQRTAFLSRLFGISSSASSNYISAIQGLSGETSREGVRWLELIITSIHKQADAIMPSIGLFDNRRIES
jgi:hypothetical protein